MGLWTGFGNWDEAATQARMQEREQDMTEQGSRVANWFAFEDDPAELRYLQDAQNQGLFG
jgi:hypothetical protein